MNRFSLLLLLLFSSCSSHRPQQTEIPVFVKEKVCSPEALAYFLKANKNPTKVYSSEEISPYVHKLEPLIRSCYEQEMHRTGQQNAFNLCFVTGLDKRGNKDFFQFSTSEVMLTLELKKCLDDIKHQIDFRPLKDVTILQPFRLFPKQ